jgi:hypothetical protein
MGSGIAPQLELQAAVGVENHFLGRKMFRREDGNAERHHIMASMACYVLGLLGSGVQRCMAAAKINLTPKDAAVGIDHSLGSSLRSELIQEREREKKMKRKSPLS